MEYLLGLAHERYNILAQWPDFSSMFGKEYYYRCRQPGWRVGGGGRASIQ
jgi:hypothetical protein